MPDWSEWSAAVNCQAGSCGFPSDMYVLIHLWQTELGMGRYNLYHTWVWWLMAHEWGFAQADALAFASSDWGMSVHLPSPSKRQPWYEHISVPSDDSTRPSANRGARIETACDHYFDTLLSCPRQGASTDKLQLKAANLLPLVEFARSKQDHTTVGTVVLMKMSWPPARANS